MYIIYTVSSCFHPKYIEWYQWHILHFPSVSSARRWCRARHRDSSRVLSPDQPSKTHVSRCRLTRFLATTLGLQATFRPSHKGNIGCLLLLWYFIVELILSTLRTCFTVSYYFLFTGVTPHPQRSRVSVEFSRQGHCKTSPLEATPRICAPQYRRPRWDHRSEQIPSGFQGGQVQKWKPGGEGVGLLILIKPFCLFVASCGTLPNLHSRDLSLHSSNPPGHPFEACHSQELEADLGGLAIYRHGVAWLGYVWCCTTTTNEESCHGVFKIQLMYIVNKIRNWNN